MLPSFSSAISGHRQLKQCSEHLQCLRYLSHGPPLSYPDRMLPDCSVGNVAPFSEPGSLGPLGYSWLRSADGGHMQQHITSFPRCVINNSSQSYKLSGNRCVMSHGWLTFPFPLAVPFVSPYNPQAVCPCRNRQLRSSLGDHTGQLHQMALRISRDVWGYLQLEVSSDTVWF